MTIKEAAPYIGSSEYKLREMARQKEIAHYRVGNRIMFRKVMLDEWISKQEQENVREKV
ncbi:helix-turn-helix domain-containing protein [Neobacillus sp. PS3-40]|uniref:helix-turn-helix domain-containing protein n=1 Tax=Neobacillus sp. PS3-40 TaxID=3070679 RepID=UPI0027E163BE|nr:helix-turn-helix domain-containing protein [Neobacillus sp. PS3-40]WML46444.1 helix-turn-helix domain-containing protein [Neobacillus sp. PS3-40]